MSLKNCIQERKIEKNVEITIPESSVPEKYRIVTHMLSTVLRPKFTLLNTHKRFELIIWTLMSCDGEIMGSKVYLCWLSTTFENKRILIKILQDPLSGLRLSSIKRIRGKLETTVFRMLI